MSSISITLRPNMFEPVSWIGFITHEVRPRYSGGFQRCGPLYHATAALNPVVPHRRVASQPEDLDHRDPMSCRLTGPRRTWLSTTTGREAFVSNSGSAPRPAGKSAEAPASWAERIGRIGIDWWATIVAGVIVLLAVSGLLPKIPW